MIWLLSPRLLTITKGVSVSLGSLRTHLSSSSPLSPGISQSLMIRSICWRFKIDWALRPSEASLISLCGRNLRIVRLIRSRMKLASSASRMRIFMSFLFTQKYRLRSGGVGGVEAVTANVETLQRIWVLNAVTNNPGRHHAAGLFGVKADDLVVAVFIISEYWADHRHCENLFVHRPEVLL